MNYKKLLEKYMRDIIVQEGTAFVDEVWRKYTMNITKEEHTYLSELSERLWNEAKI